jgi:hypothetical protein
VVVAVALPTGIAIESLPWLLRVGRVVSPVDALLNATGTVLTALPVTRFPQRRAARVRALLLRE